MGKFFRTTTPLAALPFLALFALAGCSEQPADALLAPELASNSTRGNASHARYDQDGNGIPDEGAVVTGKYSLSQGGCDYQVQYRGTFENTPFLDTGWIINTINCGDGAYNYLIVHETDPRYRGNPEWAIWNTWEIHTLTVSGVGNLVRPENHTP